MMELIQGSIKCNQNSTNEVCLDYTHVPNVLIADLICFMYSRCSHKNIGIANINIKKLLHH